MPRISAGSVKEHRAQVQSALVDAAEELLRDGRELTAGAVTGAAGIARNSIYRYVDSVDDLRGLVLARHLPRWTAAVEADLAGVDDPRERIVAWARANLEQAAASGHGWLMEVARGLAASATGVDAAHDAIQKPLLSAFEELGDPTAGIDAAVVRAIVDAGFRRLDAGDAPAVVIARVTASVGAVLTTL